MGRSMLFVVSAAILASLGAMNQMNDNTQGAQLRQNVHDMKMLARELAQTGLSDARQAVFNGYVQDGSYLGPSPITGSFKGGTYSVEVTQGGQITLKSVGEFDGQQHTFLRVYEVPVISTGVPPFMAQAVTCDGNLHIDDNLTLQSGNPATNASVHSNGNLHVNGGTALIEGFGHYGGNLNIGNGQLATDIFQPNDNPGGAPVHEQVTEIEMEEFDPATFASIATQADFTNVELSGNYTLGTALNPVIWYIKGNVTTGADASFSGYGVILVDGNIHLSHSVSVLGATVESTFGIYAGGNIHVDQENLNLGGQWFLNGNVHLKDNTAFIGTITSTDGNCHYDSPFNMTYRPASPALTEPFWTGTGTSISNQPLVLVSSREW